MVAPPQADLLAQGWEVPVFPQSPGLLPARPAVLPLVCSAPGWESLSGRCPGCLWGQASLTSGRSGSVWKSLQERRQRLDGEADLQRGSLLGPSWKGR